MGRPDRSEFSEFALARGRALQRAAYLMVGDTQLAQDLVQEALTRTYVAWPRLRDPRNAEAYCRKAITTTAISWFRRKGWNNERPTETLPEGTGQRLAGHKASIAEHDAVWRALLTLPPRQRAALVLRFYEDLTEAQTAAAMGCAVGTVKSQVSAGPGQAPERTRRRRRAALRERDHRRGGDEPMTGQLRSTLHMRAADLEIWESTLEAIVRGRQPPAPASSHGARRGVGCPGARRRGRGRRPARPAREREPGPVRPHPKPFGYAVGSVIHSGLEAVDVGVTSTRWSDRHGLVFADPRLRVCLETNGDVRRIGHLADRQHAPRDGRRRAGSGLVGRPELSAWPGLDGHTDDHVRPDRPRPATSPEVEAISDGHVWLWEGRRLGGRGPLRRPRCRGRRLAGPTPCRTPRAPGARSGSDPRTDPAVWR